MFSVSNFVICSTRNGNNVGKINSLCDHGHDNLPIANFVYGININKFENLKQDDCNKRD